jgi:pyridinium-3,5-biscarboxylic acid mononucleotide sulfurtransferase
MKADTKRQKLEQLLKAHAPVAIAFSGGVDSTYLLAIAVRTIPGKVLAITVKSPYIPQWEVDEAKAIAKSLGTEQIILSLPVPETIINNPPDRCYLCKKILFTEVLKEAVVHGIHTVFDGTNADDKGDYRPGMKALTELNVISPLLEAGISKSEIRSYSKEMGLPTFDKPAYACLLTRIPYDTAIQLEDLVRIEKSETFLISQGFRAIRVRHHGSLARIEADPGYFEKILSAEYREKIVLTMKDLGYDQICLDLEGYRMGSFNKSIK